ncbi:MAG: hypothetical protein LBR39_06480 [Coriobacteriales bacterium]|nr:hypothetical protein [Coriobacteriales bacterium]
MDTTSKRLEDDRVELNVTIDAAEVDKSVTAAYKEAGKARIHGFRPGKAPRHVMDNVFGGKEYFLGQATDSLVKATFPLAIDAEGYVALDSPDFEELQLVEEGKDYSYTLTFGVTPQLELSSYDPVEVELPSAEADEAEVENQVQVMLSYYVDLEGNKPELTDEWVKEQLDYEDVADFRNRIAESIKAQKAMELPQLKERLILDALIKRVEGEPPAVLVSGTEQDIYRDFFNSLQRSGLTFDGWLAQRDITPEAFRADAHQQAVEGATQGLALDAVARHEQFEVTEAEILAEFERSGAENTQALYEGWKNSGRLSELREGLLRMKALEHLKETAIVTETPVVVGDAASDDAAGAAAGDDVADDAATADPADDAAATDAAGAEESATEKPEE